jgi:two-component system OmpR family response regulator
VDHLLIVDDDPGIRRLLTRYLSEEGYRVAGAADGREMRRALDAAIPDLIVLDLMLPGEDGLTLFRSLNADSAIPVIILTARDEASDRVLGLEFGADDYVPKPFEPRELLARIKSVLRRVRRLPPSLEPDSVKRYRFAGWDLDVTARELISPEAVVISLSGTEFRLLKGLLDRPRQVIGRDHLANLVWGKDVSPLDRGMDVLMSRLRQRLGDDARNPKMLKTVRYEGYKLDADVVVED